MISALAGSPSASGLDKLFGTVYVPEKLSFKSPLHCVSLAPQPSPVQKKEDSIERSEVSYRSVFADEISQLTN